MKDRRREGYEDNRLYCVTCKEQPEGFIEVMAGHVNPVTPEGALREPWSEKLHVTGYQCSACGGTADWGSELNEGG